MEVILINIVAYFTCSRITMTFSLVQFNIESSKITLYSFFHAKLLCVFKKKKGSKK